MSEIELYVFVFTLAVPAAFLFHYVRKSMAKAIYNLSDAEEVEGAKREVTVVREKNATLITSRNALEIENEILRSEVARLKAELEQAREK